MAKSWGKIQDYSAVDDIDRDEPTDNKEEYESQYTQDDIALLGEQEQAKALAAQAASAKKREQEALAELEKALAEARLRGQREVMPSEADSTLSATPPDTMVQVKGTIDEENRSVKAPAEDDKASEVVKKVKTSSDYFNTLAKDAKEPRLIQAIIDEDIKAVTARASGCVCSTTSKSTRAWSNGVLTCTPRSAAFVRTREREHQQHTGR